MAQLLFIVSRTEPRTYMDIQRQCQESRYARVLLDRRGYERRRSQSPLPTERRHLERRQQDVTRELRSSGWAVVRRPEDVTLCVEPGCPEEGIVGLNGAWLCLTHFDIRFAAMQAGRGEDFSFRSPT
jgi:hypothetical protein